MDEGEDANDFISNPEYASVFDEAAYSVWSWANHSYRRDESFEDRLNEVSQEKPLTVALVDYLYKEFIAEKTRSSASVPQNAIGDSRSEELTPTDPNDLTDEEVATAYHTAMRDRARSNRRSSL